MSNVVSLKDFKRRKEIEDITVKCEPVANPDSLEEIARKNKENEERLKRERILANTAVKRSHRLPIKDDKITL